MTLDQEKRLWRIARDIAVLGFQIVEDPDHCPKVEKSMRVAVEALEEVLETLGGKG